MKTLLVRYCCAVLLVAALCTTAFAAEPLLPDYFRKAQDVVDQASVKSLQLNAYTDEVLIAKNLLKNAEAEYKKGLSWTGKLDPKAEPAVRYFSSMAEIQASVVLARAGKVAQEKERARLEQQLGELKAKIKVFDDKNAEIDALKKGITELNAALLAIKEEKEQLTSKSSALGSDVAVKSTALTASERRVAGLAADLEACAGKLKGAEQKVALLTGERDQALAEIGRLKGEVAALAAAKGAAESQSKEQIEALNRQKEFVAEVGNLGGVIKPGSDNMTVIFVRSGMIKAPKNDMLTADGDKAVGRIAELLKKYPEFRVKLKVHGFGQPAKSEDAAATDRMARLIREVLLAKGNFDPAMVEALGAGSAEPIYPKNNPEGNRRVEVTFVRK